MFNIKTILISSIAAFLLGGFGGYKWERGNTLEQKARADTLEQGIKAANEKHEALVATLRNNVKQLQEISDRQLKEADVKFEDYKKSMERNLAKKNDEIAVLKIAITNRQAQLELLRQELGKATTPEQRKQLEERIKEQERLLQQAELRSQGLACLDVPVPVEYLAQIRGI